MRVNANDKQSYTLSDIVPQIVEPEVSTEQAPLIGNQQQTDNVETTVEPHRVDNQSIQDLSQEKLMNEIDVNNLANDYYQRQVDNTNTTRRRSTRLNNRRGNKQ